MINGLADAMLVLSLLHVRPAAERDWPLRLRLHAALLACCLLAGACTPGAPRALCAAGSLFAIAVLVLHLRLGGRARLDGRQWPAAAVPPPNGRGPWRQAGLGLAGIAFAALAVALVPAGALPAWQGGVLAASLGMLLTALLAALAAGGGRPRVAALLPGANGLVLAACLLPGMGGAGLLGILLVEGGLLWMLLRPDRRNPGPAMAA